MDFQILGIKPLISDYSGNSIVYIEVDYLECPVFCLFNSILVFVYTSQQYAKLYRKYVEICEHSWVREQQESEGVTPGEDVYIVLRLDGRVRKSGRVSCFNS